MRQATQRSYDEIADRNNHVRIQFEPSYEFLSKV